MGLPWRKLLIWAGEQAIKLAEKKLAEKKAPGAPTAPKTGK